MGCRGGKPCACEDCGPFMISGMGRFNTLEGDPLPYRAVKAPGRRARADQHLRRRFTYDASAEPLGPRLRHAWTPEGDVGLPPSDRSTYVPLGSTLEEGLLGAPAGMSMGAGGQGGGGASESSAAEPIGTRPSVPARIGVNFERVGRPAVISHEPYGMMPLETGMAPPPGTIGSPFAGDTAESLRLVEPYRQFIPPLPASQDVCIVNGFDPRWGEPPRTYKGVVVRFDYAKGAYIFNPQDEALRQAFRNAADPHLMAWFKDMEQRYASGFMLQPYKPTNGDGSWSFRWIPKRQEVVCV